jgi:hypothetical protein
LGHWHNDPECPEKDKPFKKGKGGGGKGKKSRKKKKKKKKLPKRQHTAHKTKKSYQTFVMTTNGLDLPQVGYADTACAKSVVGKDNADSVVEFCKQNQWPYELVPDKEPFRFGPGKRIWSTDALLIAMIWGNATIVLRFSIVAPTVPFLISKFVFKRL